MTFSLTIGGTDVAGKMVLPEGLGELTSAADGQSNECLITVDDPDGSLTFLELDDVIAEESACAYPRSFTGIVTQSNHRRGTYKDGPGRVWDITITDLNERMHRRVLHDADANRSSETGTERLDWLMSSVALDGLLVDNGQIMANAWEYDTADYRGEYADDVLSSIVSASAVARWTFFAYWDPIAEGASLFYGDITTTTYDSTLSLTNYLPDKNDTTIFAPYVDVALTSEAEGIYDGVYVDCVAGKFYRQRASTFATYGKHRDGVMDSVRINNATTASRHMETYLDYHSGPTKVITATVQLPREQVNLIDAGMRVQVYFTHIEGYDDPGYTWVRVTRRTVTFTNGRNDLYDVHLELSTRGISQTGGGNPGDFPHQVNCATATLVQSADVAGASGSLAATLGVAPTAGNLLICAMFVHEYNTSLYTLPAGFTEHPDSPLDAPNPGLASNSNGHERLFYKVSDGTDGSVTIIISQAVRMVLCEFAGAWQTDDTDSATAAYPSPIVPPAGNALGSVTATAPGLVIGAGIWATSATIGAGATIDRGTIIADGDLDGGFHGPTLGLSWEAVAAAGTVSPTMTLTGPPTAVNGTAGLLWAFSCSDSAVNNPPSPGQPFGPVIPVEIPDGTTTTFTLPAGYEWAAGSLRVYVDRLDQTAAITSQDGGARTFTLAFAPKVGELVEAYAQGAT